MRGSEEDEELSGDGGWDGTEAEETAHVPGSLVTGRAEGRWGLGQSVLWKALEGPGRQCFQRGRIRACRGCRTMCSVGRSHGRS